MIIGTLKNRSRYEQLGENYRKAFDWLENNDICSLEDGCYTIDGETIYAYVQRYNTMDAKNCNLESHKHYADLHYIASGRERLLYTPEKRAGTAIGDYDKQNDLAFWTGSCESSILLETGDFAIVFPEDYHMPKITVEQNISVVKACIKIKV